MESAVDADALDRVLADHPWLVEALRKGDWWRRDDGSLQFSLLVESHEGTREGLIAFVEALGLRLEEGSEPTVDLPDEPPMSFEEVFG